MQSTLALLGALIGLAVPIGRASSQEQVQFGLRMDSRSAMQWSGNLLMAKSTVSSYVRLPVDGIVDVWPGPVRGSFAVEHARGVGMLLGGTVVPSSLSLGAGMIARSSRPDVVFVYRPAIGQASRRIVELRTGGRTRDLLTPRDEITDFDVTVAGRIALLAQDGSLQLYAEGPSPTSVIPSSVVRALLGGRTPERIFVDADGSELTLLGASALVSIDLKTGKSVTAMFDQKSQALVRHAVSRRMRVEPRWSPSF